MAWLHSSSTIFRVPFSQWYDSFDWLGTEIKIQVLVLASAANTLKIRILALMNDEQFHKMVVFDLWVRVAREVTS